MIIAIVHGYILRGTGSNLYVTNLCRAFCKAGHDVMLFSQESRPQDFDFIAQSHDFNKEGALTSPTFHQINPLPGKCTHYRPFIDHFLPVYVYDDYPGYRVKTYTEASETEIETYLSHNTKCLQAAFRAHPPDLILSQHTIMQPVYTARARISCPTSKHFVIVHGSALNFSVRKSDLLKTYALEGIEDAHQLIFVSRHSQNDFVQYFSHHPQLASKCNVIPAGVNIDLFQSPHNKEEKLIKLQKWLNTSPKTSPSNAQGKTTKDKQNFHQAILSNPTIESIKESIKAHRQNTNIWSPDQDIRQNLSRIFDQKDKTVLYFGKYLWTKGIHLLIAAAPFIVSKHPQVHFILTGFGSTRAYFETLVSLLDGGQMDLFATILSQPHLVDPEGTGTSVYINNFLSWLSTPENKETYRSLAYRNIQKRMTFTGILKHTDLIHLIPSTDITVAPSIFPESFGMVAIESLACGVFPVQTYHSGFADVIDHYENEFKEFFSTFSWKPIELNDSLIFSLADNITNLLNAQDQLTAQEKISLSQRAHAFVQENYDWVSIAKKMLSLVISA